MQSSIEFTWDPAEFGARLAVCEQDEGVRIALRELTDRNMAILEAGCGDGRVVKYLHDVGYKNVHGVELNRAIVTWFNRKYPEIPVVQGDILKMSFAKATFDAVLSFGVVEHFREGPIPPLQALHRILRPGGCVVVTVPSFNLLRRLWYGIDRVRDCVDPRRWGWLRKWLRKPVLSSRNRGSQYLYHVNPLRGEFFEYQFTRREFESACVGAGYRIIRSVPIAHLDGLYHECGRWFVDYRDARFHPSPWGVVVNGLLSRIPFFHNHMHAVVLAKP